MGKASAAVAGGALLATGLIGVGSPAFANTGGADSAPDPAPAPQPTEHQTNATAPQDKDLIGVNAPVALDLHRGVANDLNVSDVARDVAVVGDVVPAKPDAQGEHGKHAKAADTKADDGKSNVAADAGNGPAKPIGDVAAKAEATVNDVGGSVAQPVSGVVTSVDQTAHSVVQSAEIGQAR